MREYNKYHTWFWNDTLGGHEKTTEEEHMHWDFMDVCQEYKMMEECDISRREKEYVQSHRQEILCLGYMIVNIMWNYAREWDRD